jgi:hypothetical protein
LRKTPQAARIIACNFAASIAASASMTDFKQDFRPDEGATAVESRAVRC